MPLDVKFPPGFGDEPVPSLAPPQVSVAPTPWDPQPDVSPWVEPEPQVSQVDPLNLPPPLPLPQSRMPPPGLRVDLTGIDDTAPTIGPAPAPGPNPFINLFDP